MREKTGGWTVQDVGGKPGIQMKRFRKEEWKLFPEATPFENRGAPYFGIISVDGCTADVVFDADAVDIFIYDVSMKKHVLHLQGTPDMIRELEHTITQFSLECIGFECIG